MKSSRPNECSREAAQECSPRREPWESGRTMIQLRRSARKLICKPAGRCHTRLTAVCSRASLADFSRAWSRALPAPGSISCAYLAVESRHRRTRDPRRCTDWQTGPGIRRSFPVFDLIPFCSRRIEFALVYDVDRAFGPHHRNFGGWPRVVHIGPYVFRRHHAVCAAIGLARNDRTFGTVASA